MKMVSVNSKAISEVGYDPITQQMQIKFKQGHSYSFCRVPPSIYAGLLSAKSIGAYYNSQIEGKYNC
jgi:hypothetical protein